MTPSATLVKFMFAALTFSAFAMFKPHFIIP